MSSVPPTLESIRALRGIAAMAVAVSHVEPFLPASSQMTTWFPFALGKIGVDIFFVISGFVMALSTEAQPVGIAGGAGFLWRRLARIVPLYWIVTLGLVAAIALDVNLGGQRHVDLEATLLSLLFLPVHTAEGAIRPVIAVGWTLDYEMYFYLCMAVVLSVTNRHRLVGTVAVLAVIYLIARMLLDPTVDWVVNSGLIAEFMLGFVAATCYRDVRRTLLVILAAGGACVLSWPELARLHPFGVEFTRTFSWGMVALMIVIAAAAFEHRRPFGGVPGLGTCGDASYALYLVHVPVFAIVYRLAGSWSSWQHAAVLGLASLLAAVLLASWMVHRLIEYPLTRRLQRMAPDIIAVRIRPSSRHFR